MCLKYLQLYYELMDTMIAFRSIEFELDSYLLNQARANKKWLWALHILK
jgi:hypothetical protein